MSKIKESALELIGGTPLLKLNGYTKKKGITEAVILGKLEYLNPAGSVKDRIALAMIEDAEKKRSSEKRIGYHRTNQWKYRNWISSCSCGQGIQGYSDTSGYNEYGTEESFAGIWR